MLISDEPIYTCKENEKNGLENFLLKNLGRNFGLLIETEDDTLFLFRLDNRLILKSLKSNQNLCSSSRGHYGFFLDSWDEEITISEKFEYGVKEKKFVTKKVLSMLVLNKEKADLVFKKNFLK